MSDIERELRRAPLKSLVHQPQDVAERRALVAALERLDKRALEQDVLVEVREVLAKSGRDKSSGTLGDPGRAAELVASARVLYGARLFSRQEYVFHAVSWVEGVNDARWLDGAFNSELDPIREEIDAIERRHGLNEDEDWPREEGPEEYRCLIDKYDAILDKKLLAALREFGLDDLAHLKEQDPEEFDRLRERGRRSVFHGDEHALAIRDIVVRFEQDARRAASAKAYSAAVISLGAGVEGLLLLRCLRSPVKASRVAKRLPKRIRQRYPDEPATWTFEALIEVCLKANWLPTVETSFALYDTARLAHMLRLMRNYVHPGKYAKEKPWSETDQRDYQDADHIYIILLSTLGKVHRSRGVQAASLEPTE